jgi:2-succinyl-6-hydroxy-2,4-cyclohexadiene-1-carboxylate synthase
MFRSLGSLSSQSYDGAVAETLVLLHGFGGTRQAWDRVIAHLDPQRYRPLALDLPGHGTAAPLEGPVTFAACVESVLAAGPERFALCGYSMGGRIAMQVALAAPARVTRLAFVSSSPGIEDPIERARRRSADRQLADELEQAPFEHFIERWRSQRLFAEDPREVHAIVQEQQRRNGPLALAAALRGLGTGEMEPMWDRLGELEAPVTVVAGERDLKFLAIGRRMNERLPGSKLVTIPGGHRLPLESPEQLARAIEA